MSGSKTLAFGSITTFSGSSSVMYTSTVVIAEGVIEGGADHLDAGRQLRIRRRIELDLICPARLVLHPESGLDPAGLTARHDPAVERDAGQRIGPSDDLFHGHLPAPDSIREPARVRDFVNRVHVQRAHVARLAEIGERVGHEVVEVRVLDRAGLRRVQRLVVVDPDRIVGIEARWSAATPTAPPRRRAAGHQQGPQRALKKCRRRRCGGVCHLCCQRPHRRAR